jgi:2-C-methyl-D-erythritol 4-phosphate cytidylyltransferase
VAVSVWVVVVAAGGGRRFGGPKQFTSVGGRPLVAWSLSAARAVADGVVLVVPADSHHAGVDHHGADAVVRGGATRAASVRAGLDAVPDSADIIVVHDGVRPLAGAALFRSVVEAVEAGAPAAVPALALADTVKRVDAGGAVVTTLDRGDLVAVQTPQAFRAEVLRRAHRGADDATDDAGLVEAQGATVRVVPGDPRNLKVTTPADLDIVRALLEKGPSETGPLETGPLETGP